MRFRSAMADNYGQNAIQATALYLQGSLKAYRVHDMPSVKAEPLL
jgi:hypothetical protein